MMRVRNAIALAIVSLLVGIGLGAVGSAPVGSPAPATGIAIASHTPSNASSRSPERSVAPTVEPTPSPTPVPVEPIVVKGSGSQNTKPFDLPAGDLTVTITGSGDGNVIASLELRGGDVLDREGLFNELPSGDYKYETVVYGLAAGSYYLDMLNDGAWVVTFTPLQ
jgi:hypothetical protein